MYHVLWILAALFYVDVPVSSVILRRVFKITDITSGKYIILVHIYAPWAMEILKFLPL